MRDVGIILLTSAALMLAVDLVAGWSIMTMIAGSSEKYYRVRHPIYHHGLRSDVDTDRALWGPSFYRVCTNSLGFKSDCKQRAIDVQHYDIAFIGDSFTEAIGMPYEDSFVGIVDHRFPHLSVANLAAASYSPKIYLSKVRFLLEDVGITFDELLVFVDISDVMDDGVAYVYRNGAVYDSDGSGLDRTDVFTHNLKVAATEHFPVTYELLKLAKAGLSGDGSPAAFGGHTLGSGYQGNDVFNLDKSAWTYDESNPAYGPLGVSGATRESVKYMTELHGLLEKHHVRMSVGVYPWPGQLAHGRADSPQVRIWKEFCETRCLRLVNVFPDFFERLRQLGLTETYRRYFIPGDLHYNKEGNLIVADAITRSLQGMPPRGELRKES